MSENTGISWTDHTFNPWWGCQKVSPACDHCYAERDANRFAPGRVLWGVDSERRTFGDKHWNEPFRWDARAREAVAQSIRHKTERPRRPRVFCASMADVFDNNAPEADRARLWRTIVGTPYLDWLLLTKRIGNAWKMLPPEWVDPLVPRMPDNVWLGATVVNQEEADRDMPKLLALPARVRFLSIEPMLGPIDLGRALVGGLAAIRAGETLGWVIAGGESGPHARPASPDWFRTLRDQCAAAGVPFHFKQWGEWLPMLGQAEGVPVARKTTTVDGWVMGWAGKAAAGRLLDGIEHNGFPA